MNIFNGSIAQLSPIAFLSHQSKSCTKIWEKYIYSVNDILGVEFARASS